MPYEPTDLKKEPGTEENVAPASTDLTDQNDEPETEEPVAAVLTEPHRPKR